MPICDVCSSPTTTQEGQGYAAEEFRKMVFKWYVREKLINILNVQIALLLYSNRKIILKKMRGGIA